MVRKVWKYKGDNVRPGDIKAASERTGVPYIVAGILLNRGVKPSEFSDFLSKTKRSIINPLTMLDMDKASARIIEAIRNGERIVIYGDYDVDGITSTALLYDFLKSEGADVGYYIPDRQDEGYGINIMAVNRLIKEGVKLLITVDCGITAIGEVEFAKLQGVDVIITDHHTCKERLPLAADAIVNPKREDDEYEFDALAGVGVAFKLAMAVAMGLGKNAADCFDRYVDLAAIGTVADVVPLVGENRVIVDKGLALLQNPKRCGISALLAVAGVADKKVTASTVAFAIAPRINAAGRLKSAVTAVDLLTTDDESKALEIANELDRANKERQETEYEINREALAMIENDKDLEKKKVIILAKEGWHNGVIGIVASRIVEKFYKPCILMSVTNGVGKGSGRSISSFNLFDALSACEEYLTNFGGHSVAAGLGINMENIDAFDKAINKYAHDTLSDDDMVPVIKIDCILSGAQLNLSTAKLLSTLEPYGMGNEVPVFAIKDATVTQVYAVGNEGKHIRMQIEKDGVRVNCIGFGMGEFCDFINVSQLVHLAFKLDINNYMGNETLQLMLTDIKIAD